MQRTSPTTHATPFFSSLFGGEGGKRRKSNGNSSGNGNGHGRTDNDMIDPSSPAGEGAPPPVLPSKSPKSPRKRPSFGRSRPGTSSGAAAAAAGVVGSGDPNSIPIPAGGDQSSAGAASPSGVQLPHAQGPGQLPALSTLPQLTSSSTTAQDSPITKSSPSGPYKTPRSSTSQASASTNGNSAPGEPGTPGPRQRNVLHKDPKEKDPPKRENRDRQLSFGRKPSLSSLIHRHRRTASSLSTTTSGAAPGGNGPGSGAAQVTPTPTTSAPSSGRSSLSRKPSLHLVTSHSSYSSSAIPPVPGIALAASRLTDAVLSPRSATETINFSKMLSRGAPTPVNGFGPSTTQLAPPAMVAPGPQSELGEVHARIQETANKRISTLDYLRKAYGHFPLLQRFTLLSESQDHMLTLSPFSAVTKAVFTGSTRSSLISPTYKRCPISTAANSAEGRPTIFFWVFPSPPFSISTATTLPSSCEV